MGSLSASEDLFPWGWFCFWVVVCFPIAILIVLVKRPLWIVLPIVVLVGLVIAFHRG